MVLTISVGLVEGSREFGRVARRRRSGRPCVDSLLIVILVVSVQLPVIHRRRIEGRGLVATIMVPVNEVGLGGRPVGVGRGRWGGSAQIPRWLVEGRLRFEGSGLNHSNLFEAGLFQGRCHGLLLLLRWMIFGSLPGFLGLPVIHYEI
jgi:hypothetical protein